MTRRSSSRCLTIRCRTMTAIHRSGRYDKRDIKVVVDVAWECRAVTRHTTTAESRGMSENCFAARAKGANEPDICVSGPRCYMKRMKPPLCIVFVVRPLAIQYKKLLNFLAKEYNTFNQFKYDCFLKDLSEEVVHLSEGHGKTTNVFQKTKAFLVQCL